MCGFICAINFDPPNKKRGYETWPDLKHSIKSIKNRGPDEINIISFDMHNVENKIVSKFSDHYNINKNSSFCIHSRLAITDPSNILSRQPKLIKKGNLIFLFNGQIFNYHKLNKEKLKNKFDKDISETHVLASLWEKYGSNCLNMLNGIFSICVVNLSQKKIIFTRDHIGTKPLYYGIKDNKLVISSTPYPISELLKKTELNRTVVRQYIKTGKVVYKENSFIEGIKLAQAATIYEVVPKRVLDIHKKTIWKGFSLNSKNDFNIGIIENGILNQTSSDVSICSLLSGGIDSSLINVIANKHCDLAKKEFSIETAFTGEALEKDISEVDQASKTASKIGIKHKKVKIPNNPSKIYEDFIKCNLTVLQNESYLFELIIFKAINKEGFKVTLTGHGADEICGGYIGRFAIFAIFETLIKLQISNAFKILFTYKKAINYSPKALLSLIYRYLNNAFSLMTFRNLNLKISFKDRLNLLFLPYTLERIRETYSSDYLQEHLISADISSMYFGVEARVPFLDINIINHMINLNSFQDGLTKKFFRDYLNLNGFGHIAKTIKKTGFSLIKEENNNSPIVNNIINNRKNFRLFSIEKLEQELRKKR